MSMTTPSQYGGPTPDPNPTPGPLFTGLDPYTAPSAPSAPATGTSTAAALAGIKVSEVPWQQTPWGTLPASGKQAFRFTGFTSDRIGFAFEQPPDAYYGGNTDGAYSWVLPRVFVNGTEVFPFPADPWGADQYPDGGLAGNPGVYGSGVGSLWLTKPGVIEYVTGGTRSPAPAPGGADVTLNTPGWSQIAPTEVIIFGDSLFGQQAWSFCWGIPGLDTGPMEPADDTGTTFITRDSGWHRAGPAESLIEPEEWSKSFWAEQADFFGVATWPGLIYAWVFSDPIGLDYNDPANFPDTPYTPNGQPYLGVSYQFYFLPTAYQRSGWLRVNSGNPNWEYVGSEYTTHRMKLWTGLGSIQGGYVQDKVGGDVSGSSAFYLTFPYTAGMLKMWDGGGWSFCSTFGTPNSPAGSQWLNQPVTPSAPVPGPLFTGDTGSSGTPGPIFTGGSGGFDGGGGGF